MPKSDPENNAASVTSNLVKSVTSNLVKKDYPEVLNGLYRIGHLIKKEWDDELKKTGKTPEKHKFSSNPKFKEFLVDKIKSALLQTQSKDEAQQIQQLEDQLFLLAFFLIVWKDRAEKDEQDSSQESEANKKLHQETKFKGTLDKDDDRYAINIGLQSMVFILCQQNEKTFTDQFTQSNNKQALLKLIYKRIISKRITSLNKLESDSNHEISHKVPSKQELEKIGAAISAFPTPNIKKKIIKHIGILLAFIAAIACGTTTGGAFFLLFPSLPLLGFILGGLIALWGFSANFGFFSQNLPDFLLRLLKKGGISEYIDEEGNRRQLSKLKKYLFIPLAIVASLTVGLGTVAITYTTVIALASKLLVISAFIWPPLFPIIAGILAISVGITLTVAVLTATIELIKNSQNFSRGTVKNTLNNLSTRQIIGYVFKGLLVLVGLLGLAYFRYVAGIDLSNIIQPVVGLQAAQIISVITGVIAYIPQAFFTIFSIQKLTRFFSSPNNPSQEGVASLPQSLYYRIKSRMTKIYKLICLIGNALGNAVLVITGKISTLSIFGGIGCFLNSWAGNTPEHKDTNAREKSTQSIVKEVENFITKIKIKLSASTDNFEPGHQGDLTLIHVKLKEPSKGQTFFQRGSNNNSTESFFQRGSNNNSTESLGSKSPLVATASH